MRQTLDARQMRRLVVFDLQSGQLRTVLRDRVWFNHLQFSPTDPNMLKYCHEGPWDLVGPRRREHLVRPSGSARRQILRDR